MSDLLNHIPTGKENAIHADALADQMNVCERSLRLMIRKEREAGAVIVGDKSGYYLPADHNELTRHVATMRRRALGSLASIKPARQRADIVPGQKVLEV